MPQRRIRGELTIPVPPGFDASHPKADDRLVQLIMIYRARGCKVRAEKVVFKGRPAKTRPTQYRLHLDCPRLPKEQDKAFRDLIETYMS